MTKRNPFVALQVRDPDLNRVQDIVREAFDRLVTGVSSVASRDKSVVIVPRTGVGDVDLSVDITAAGGVPATRRIDTTAPLIGGGPLSSDLTLSLATDGTLVVTGGVLSRAALSGDVAAAAGSNVTTIQPNVVTYAKIQQVSASRLLGNPTASLANASEISLGTGLAFSGGALVNTSPLSSLTATPPLFISGTSINIHGAVVTGSTSTTPTNLGLLASGVLQQTVAGGVSTPTVFVSTAGRVALCGSNGGLTDDAGLTYNVVGPTLNLSGSSGSNAAGFFVRGSNSVTGALYRMTNDVNRTFQFILNGSASPTNPDTLLASSTATGGLIFQSITRIAFSLSALATNAQTSFVQLQSMPGVPTGTPTNIVSGQIPIVIDSTHDRFYAFNGTFPWKIYGQYDGSLLGAPGILKTDASGVHSIAVSGTDYAPAGSYITALTGDVTATGPGSAAATIGANKVTYAKIQTVTGARLLGNPTASAANVSEISIGTGLSLSVGGVLSATGGTGTVTSVAGTAPIVITGTPTTTPTVTLAFDGASLTLNGSSQLQRAALTGDVTAVAGSNATTLVNIPSGTTAAGTINFTQIAAPAGPAAGHTLIWADSTNGGLWAKDGSATSHTVQSAGPIASRWVAAINDNGTLTLTQPSYSDLSGSVPAITALTGDGTATGPGSVAFTLANIPNDVTMAGDLLATAIAAPATPSTGKARIYVDSTSKNISVKNDVGVVNHGAHTVTAPAHQFLTALAADGSWTSAQPSYSDLSGSVPAITQLTGDVTAGPGSGSQAATVVAVHETSGPTQLTIGAVPDSAPDATIVIRPAGSPTLAGVAARDLVQLHPVVTASYYVTLTAATLFGTAGAGGWVPLGTTTTLDATNKIEIPVPFAAFGIQVMANVISNTVTAGAAISIGLTRNGGTPSSGGSVTFAGGATGVKDSTEATGQVSAAGDTWGLLARQNVMAATGTLVAIVTVYLYG